MNARTRLVAALAALAIIGAACSNDDGGTTEAADSGTTTTVADAEPEGDAAAEGSDTTAADDVAMSDVTLSITEVSFESSTVTIQNHGDTEVSLDGMFMCNRPSYAGLPAEVLAPGDTLAIDVTELDIRGSGGEFGLYSSGDFGDATAIVDYVQWGGGENGRASVAVEAGLIGEGEFVDNAGADFTVE